MTQHLTDIHLQVLTYLSLLGETTLDELAHVSELPDSDCEAELMDMAAVGTAKWGTAPTRGWSPTPGAPSTSAA